MIDQSMVDQVIAGTRIEDIVGEFVSLKQKGSALIGLCPFHNDHKPSLHVTPSRNIFKCFVCDKGGSAVNFLMEHESMSFPEAIKYLADRLKIDIKDTEQKLDVSILEKVQQTFLKYQEQINAFIKLRGFTTETRDYFGIGYSPVENIISQNAKAKDLLHKVGVLGISEGHYYDRFRGRITFPIHSVSGKIVGWTGRANKEPKYLNSPQSEVFDKSRTLFNLNRAKKHIAKADLGYLVEGPTDVMRLHEKGIDNVVASNGTAFTKEQAYLLKRFSDNHTIMYDNDTPGLKATDKAIEILLSCDMNARVLVLPGGDPDDYFKSNDTKILEQSVDWMDYYTQDIDFNDPVKLSVIANETLRLVRLIPDEVKKIMYVRKLAYILHVSEETLGHKISFKNVEEVTVEESSALNQHERYLTWLMMFYGDVCLPASDGSTMTVAKFILDNMLGDEIVFMNPLFKKIAECFIAECPPSTYFLTHHDQDISSLAASMVSDNNFNKNEDPKTLAKDVIHSVLSMKSVYVSSLRKDIQHKILTAQKEGNLEVAIALMEQDSKYHAQLVKINTRLGRVITQ